MQSRTRIAWAPAIPGVVAGALGAILIDAYLLVTLVAIAHRTTIGGFYSFVAATALGKNAVDDPNAVGIGVALHVAVSVAWGVGYAYAAARTPQLRARPITSGIVFGVVVMLAMQLVEVAANTYALPDTYALANAFVAHTVFFGIPVAYVVTKRLGMA